MARLTLFVNLLKMESFEDSSIIFISEKAILYG
jgi:hypothetical protein